MSTAFADDSILVLLDVTAGGTLASSTAGLLGAASLVGEPVALVVAGPDALDGLAAEAGRLGAVRVSADLEGTLWADGEPYPRAMTVSVTVSPPAADEIRAAYAAYDIEAIAEMLGPVITEQTDWAGDADRWFEVEAINVITVT